MPAKRWSLPTRERGLKSGNREKRPDDLHVAPYTGAWIEIARPRSTRPILLVAPYTGAWIEIVPTKDDFVEPRVAPYTGAWIEMNAALDLGITKASRSLHGSVD